MKLFWKEFRAYSILVGFFFMLCGCASQLKNQGKVGSTLFVGSGSHQPLIVALNGSEGGNTWANDFFKSQRERFLIQGYAFLAVGYFGTRESPEKLDRIALEGIHNAVIEAAKDSRINNECIIVMGGSKGGELALTLASFYSEYKGVISFVPSSVVFSAITPSMNTSSYTYQGKEIPFVPGMWSAYPAFIKGNLRAGYEQLMTNEQAMKNSAIEVEKINGSILLLSAKQDEVWPSTEMSDQIVQRLKNKQFTHTVKHVAFAGGHSEPLRHFNVIEDFLDSEFNKTKCK